MDIQGCPAILASGNRKGRICGRRILRNNNTFCRYHKNQQNLQNQQNQQADEEQISIKDDNIYCSICLDSLSFNNLMAIIPCGHVCLCPICSPQFGPRKRYNTCPICRKTIEKINKLYYPSVNSNDIQEVSNNNENAIRDQQQIEIKTWTKTIKKFLFCQ